MNKTVKWILSLVVLLAALWTMPFITVSVKDAEGHTWKAPFLSNYLDNNNQVLRFTNFRSPYAVSKDAENALHYGEEIKCRGNTYYYDEGNDVSFTSASASGLFPTVLSMSYEIGNACAGWTTDDEIAWPIGALSEIDPDLSIEEMSEKGWFVIEDGVAVNAPTYNDFSRLIKQGVYCILRTVVIENGERTYIDVQQMEDARVVNVETGEVVGIIDQGAIDSAVQDHTDDYDFPTEQLRFRIAVRSGDEVTEMYYRRFSETTSTDPRKVSVYQGTFDHEEETVLFEYKLQ